MEDRFFKNNVVAIIKESGEIIGVERNQSERFHADIFKRIDKDIVPNYLNDFILRPEDYSGYDYATISAANGNAIFIPASMENNNIMITAIPRKMTKEQKDSVNSLLKELDNSLLYLLECERKKDIIMGLGGEDIRTYIYDSDEKKSLDNLTDLEIIEEEKERGGIK